MTAEAIWERHSEDCPLSDPKVWSVEDEGLGYSTTGDCICKQPDLPHPGISDEFWAKVPAADRAPFSEYLVRKTEKPQSEPGSTYAAGGWSAPADVFAFPEILVRRGGISFTTPAKWTKKALRKDRDRLLDTVGKQRREIRKLRRKNKRLWRLIRKAL